MRCDERMRLPAVVFATSCGTPGLPACARKLMVDRVVSTGERAPAMRRRRCLPGAVAKACPPPSPGIEELRLAGRPRRQYRSRLRRSVLVARDRDQHMRGILASNGSARTAGERSHLADVVVGIEITKVNLRAAAAASRRRSADRHRMDTPAAAAADRGFSRLVALSRR